VTPNRKRRKFWKWATRKRVFVSLERLVRQNLLYPFGHDPLRRLVPHNFKQDENRYGYIPRARREGR